MNSMREFNVYTEVPIKQTTQQRDSAIHLKSVKRCKTESEFRTQLVARGCFQKAFQLDSDNLYASTVAFNNCVIYFGMGGPMGHYYLSIPTLGLLRIASSIPHWVRGPARASLQPARAFLEKSKDAPDALGSSSHSRLRARSSDRVNIKVHCRFIAE